MVEPVVKQFDNIVQRLKNETEEINSSLNIPKESYERLKIIIEDLSATVNKLRVDYEPYQLQLLPEDVGFPEILEGNYLGSGSFGDVYLSKLNGEKVAVKVNKESNGANKNAFEEEVKRLRSLRHENIVAFRGNGIHDGTLFVVMEYIKDNLLTFIKSRSSHDGSGLSAYLTWHIARQIANGLKFLHSQDIAHHDIKPDNILIDTEPVDPRIKLCDFGLIKHVRYAPLTDEDKEGKEKKSEDKQVVAEFEREKKFDVFAFGLVVLETRTGKRPWDQYSTNQLKSAIDKEEEKLHEVEIRKSVKHWHIRDIKVSDIVIGEDLGKLIKTCCAHDRPGFDKIVEDFFGKDMENPYKLDESVGEFFACGFLKNTNIYVVDSVVPETQEKSDATALNGPAVATPSGTRRKKKENSDAPVVLPTYKLSDLKCEVQLKPNIEDYLPKDEDLLNNFYENHAKFLQMAKEKKIDNNPMLALKEIVSDREGEDEKQGITLRFIKSTYCHHRAMRDIWQKFDERQKNGILQCKSEVNKLYSTSFGLHVAILTCEKDGGKKFVFTQRSKKKGVAAPGAYTCGAVESCSVKDFVEEEENTAWVSLINTAARGIHEELGLKLEGKDLEAIHLNTTYLKFDFHEWGICGFVDLTDPRIQEKNRYSFDDLNVAFTTGPKDKFEHSSIQGVDFKLDTMVEWIRAHHLEMASSGKIAVVKVLQAFFGNSAVTKEFQKYP